jgi:hypothetical protein
MNVFTDCDSDAADGRTVDLDTMRFLLSLGYRSLNETPGVFYSIRKWKTIPQVNRDAAIVRMFGERLNIA